MMRTKSTAICIVSFACLNLILSTEAFTTTTNQRYFINSLRSNDLNRNNIHPSTSLLSKSTIETSTGSSSDISVNSLTYQFKISSEPIESLPLEISLSNNIPGPTKEEYQQGLIAIAVITILFSSNSPVIHAAFVKTSCPPPVLLMNAVTSTVALAGIFLGGPLLDATVPLPCTVTEDEALSYNDTPDELSRKAGLELGLWKMLGTTANLYGLSLTTADHGAFLIQLTTLIVPVVQGIMGVPIPKKIWTAVALALSGVFLFTRDAVAEGLVLDPTTVFTGDCLCIVAAIFYGTYDLRLFEWGKKVQPLKLIKNKITVQAGLSIALALALGRNESLEYLTTIFSGGENNVSDLWLVGSAAIWSGLAINAVAPFLQVGGQQAVGATRAQVVYASQPLWAALLSLCLLGETLGENGLVGGMLFLSAMFLASTAESPDPNCVEKNCEV